MDIIVKSKNCDVPARLRDEAIEKVEHATRFFDRLIGVEMIFREEQNPRIPEPAVVEVTARTKGHHIRAEGWAQDHRGAIDIAVSRFESQLSRYKARLVDRNRRRGRAVPLHTDNGGFARQDLPDTDAEPIHPTIVRTKRFALAPMLPEDAALQLELLDHEFYLFLNAFSGRCNVVYRRKDGQLGLIEAVDGEDATA